jgi:hypothetical protein
MNVGKTSGKCRQCWSPSPSSFASINPTNFMRSLSILFCGFVLIHHACKAQYLSKTDNEILFTWGGDSLRSGWDPYAYLLVPVRLNGCPKQFYMQFDLGSPSSMFYHNKIRQIVKKYPGAVPLTDSLQPLRDFHFFAGDSKIEVKEMMLKQFGNAPVNWNKHSIEVIGTIGSDLIRNKVLVIDYPGKRLLIGEAIPGRFAGEKYDDLMWAGRGVLLPATIKGKKTRLFFDTGSSAFELITDQETSLSMALAGSAVITYPVNSWGRTLLANSFPSGDSIEIASRKLPVKHVTYMEGASEAQVNQMKNTGMGGMTGNKLFLRSILILDIPGKKFAIAQP